VTSDHSGRPRIYRCGQQEHEHHSEHRGDRDHDRRHQHGELPTVALVRPPVMTVIPALTATQPRVSISSRAGWFPRVAIVHSKPEQGASAATTAVKQVPTNRFAAAIAHSALVVLGESGTGSRCRGRVDSTNTPSAFAFDFPTGVVLRTAVAFTFTSRPRRACGQRALRKFVTIPCGAFELRWRYRVPSRKRKYSTEEICLVEFTDGGQMGRSDAEPGWS
jgi:hypothetical protein